MRIIITSIDLQFIDFKIKTIPDNPNKRFGELNIDTQCKEEYPTFILTFSVNDEIYLKDINQTATCISKTTFQIETDELQLFRQLDNQTNISLMTELSMTAIAHNRGHFYQKAIHTPFEKKFPLYKSMGEIMPTIKEMIKMMNWLP